MGTGSTTTRAGASTAAVVAVPVEDTRTSTIVVAASNSLDPTLAPLLYRCSGVADNVEMNAALVAAAAVNGSVELLEGDYNTVLTLSVAVNVTLKAVGWGAVIHFDAGGNAITIAGDNVKIRDLKVVIVAGAGAAGDRPSCISATGRTNLEIAGCWLIGDKTVDDEVDPLMQSGIAFNTVTLSKVSGCTSEGHVADGIYLLDSTTSVISGNTLRNNDSSGIDVSSYGNDTDNTVIGNYTSGNYLTGIMAMANRNTFTGNTSIDGFYLYYANECVISGNVCEGEDAIYVIESYYTTIVGNACNRTTDVGIYLDGSHWTCVVGNTCKENAADGIYVGYSECLTISGNFAYDNGDTGIYLTNSDGSSITGNNCTGNADPGIYLASSTDVTVTGNTCVGNVGGGISISASSDSTVSGNTCNKNLEAGISISTSHNNTITGNTCKENDVNNTGWYSGIELSGSDDNLIIGNVCNENDEYGINIGNATCDRNVVINNILRGNGSGPFQNNGTDTKLAVKVFQFTEPVGQAAWQVTSPAGIVVDAADEGALAVGEAPLKIQMAVRFRVKGVALGATGVGKGMLLEININAGKPTGSEAYNAEAIAVASVISTEDDVALNDAIEWIIDAGDDPEVDDIEFGETMEMFAIFEDTGADGDIATNAAIRTISMEYV